jgi:16S rRNA (uracil1498-N3)-methyltransferase
MNLLLFRRQELEGNVGRVEGERARHICDVLKKGPGDSLKVGVAGEGRGLGLIREVSPERLSVEVEVGALTGEAAPRFHLIVALPRPLALSRLLHTAASFGVRHIDLIRAWKVPRSYFASPRLAPERIAADLRLGAEQGAQTWIPSATVHEGFRPFVEDELKESAALAPAERRFVLEPEAEGPLPSSLGRSEPVSLAFGPEGGFVEAELASLGRVGFVPARLGPAILTTEIAIAASLAQIQLLAQL